MMERETLLYYEPSITAGIGHSWDSNFQLQQKTEKHFEGVGKNRLLCITGHSMSLEAWAVFINVKCA